MIRQITSQRPSGAGRATRPGHHKLADQYAALLRKLPWEANGGGLTVGVTASTSKEGVSTVASNLARAAARMAQRQVLLVDANCRRPSIGRQFRFQIPNAEGFTEFLQGSGELEDLVYPTWIDHLSVILAGRVEEPICEAARLRDCLDQLRERFDLVVVDLPEADELSSCLTLASVLDGVLLVVEAERLQKVEVLRTKQRLAQAGANLLGAVLNKRR